MWITIGIKQYGGNFFNFRPMLCSNFKILPAKNISVINWFSFAKVVWFQWIPKNQFGFFLLKLFKYFLLIAFRQLTQPTVWIKFEDQWRNYIIVAADSFLLKKKWTNIFFSMIISQQFSIRLVNYSCNRCAPVYIIICMYELKLTAFI